MAKFKIEFSALSETEARLTVVGSLEEVGEITDRILEDRIAISKANNLGLSDEGNGYTYQEMCGTPSK